MNGDREPTTYELAILNGLQRKPQFQGLTEDQWTRVAKRRAKNRRAGTARAAQRRANS